MHKNDVFFLCIGSFSAPVRLAMGVYWTYLVNSI